MGHPTHPSSLTSFSLTPPPSTPQLSSLIPHPSSLNTAPSPLLPHHTTSLLPHHTTSLLPHPSSLTSPLSPLTPPPYPSSLLPHSSPLLPNLSSFLLTPAPHTTHLCFLTLFSFPPPPIPLPLSQDNPSIIAE